MPPGMSAVNQPMILGYSARERALRERARPACRHAWLTLLAGMLFCLLPIPARAAGSDLDVRGMDCIPKVKEIEARRPIPVLCQTEGEVKEVWLKYRLQGQKDWDHIELQESEAGYVGELPCTVTARTGTLRMYFYSRDKKDKVVGRVGKKTKPMKIEVVESSKEKPPSLPNQDPPDRCFSDTECPPEMLGSQSCPGTKKGGKVEKSGWGAHCEDTDSCKKGLECISGSCETPPACEVDEDCTSGECVDGKCHFPDPEELATRLGPPKNHWVGLHVGVDFMLMRDAEGVCGETTKDSDLFDCFDAGNPYEGSLPLGEDGHVDQGIHMGTVRMLASYEYAFSRVSLGARVGWAFRGAPQDFKPLHLEARALYSLAKDPLNQRFRPYLGLVGGYARVDASVEIEVTPSGMMEPQKVDAFRIGRQIFFGPSLSVVYAFANDSAMVINVSVLLPDLVVAPTLGYILAP